jgi:hypothetical protein
MASLLGGGTTSVKRGASTQTLTVMLGAQPAN